MITSLATGVTCGLCWSIVGVTLVSWPKGSLAFQKSACATCEFGKYALGRLQH